MNHLFMYFWIWSFTLIKIIVCSNSKSFETSFHLPEIQKFNFDRPKLQALNTSQNDEKINQSLIIEKFIDLYDKSREDITHLSQFGNVRIFQYNNQNDGDMFFKKFNTNPQLKIEERAAAQYKNDSELNIESIIGKSKIHPLSIEYPGYNGWYNNLASPDYGSVDSHLVRTTLARINDKNDLPYEIPFIIQSNEPNNPYELSLKLYAGSTSDTYQLSRNNKSVWFVAMGLHILNEILHADEPACPREMFKVEMPEDYFNAYKIGPRKYSDKFYGIFKRISYNPNTGKTFQSVRTPLNHVTSFIDGSSIYGSTNVWNNFLRTFKQGQLKTLQADRNWPFAGNESYPSLNLDGLPMKNMPSTNNPYENSFKRLFVFGDERNNESPLLISSSILWFRWHNYLANQIYLINPTWPDEWIFNEARKWTIASYQKIVLYEWLPIMLNVPAKLIPHYQGYNPHIDPAISIEFSAIVPTYLASMVPSLIIAKNENSKNTYLRLCNSFWATEKFQKLSVDSIIMGMVKQNGLAEDLLIVPDMKERFYGKANGLSQTDYVVQQLVKSMDMAVPGYHELSRQLGLPVENGRENGEFIDAITGSLAEINGTNSIGPLLQAIILNNFLRVRDGDRFWYENYRQNGLFTESEYKAIQSLSMRDIILKTTCITEKAIQKNPFVSEFINDPILGKPDTIEQCQPTYIIDYFEGSEISFILSFFLLGLVILGTLMIMYVMARKREKTALKFMECRPRIKCRDANISADEWMETNKFAPIIICFNPQNFTINLYGERREPYTRVINFDQLSHIEVYTIKENRSNHFYLLLKIPKEYDHILHFHNKTSFLNFQNEIQQFSDVSSTHLFQHEVSSRKLLFEIAFTRKDRVKQLDMFFKTAFSLAFDENFNMDQILTNEVDDDQNLENYAMDSIISRYTKYNICRKVKRIFTVKKCSLNTSIGSNQETTYDNQRGIKQISEKQGKTLQTKLKRLLQCELTPQEFAEALALKESSTFVKNMFTLVDKDKNGRISFKEFLEFTIIFSKGSSEDRARVIFDMYDSEKQGFLTKSNFTCMLESFMELSGFKLNKNELHQGLEILFNQPHLKGKQSLTFKDFVSMIHGQSRDMDELQINWEGVKFCLPKNQRKRKNGTEKNFNLKTRRTIIKGKGNNTSTSGGDGFRPISHSLQPVSSKAETFNSAEPRRFSADDVLDNNILSSSSSSNTTPTPKTGYSQNQNNSNMCQLKKRCKLHKDDTISYYNDSNNNKNKSSHNAKFIPFFGGFNGTNQKYDIIESAQSYEYSASEIRKCDKQLYPTGPTNIDIKIASRNIPSTLIGQYWAYLVRSIENYRWHIFWLILYTSCVVGIFLNKALSYSFEREHTGLRRIIGHGGAVSRGAASALMFCYSTILITMCRNLITFCRETFLRHFIPFDAALPMHKYISFLGLLFTALHVFGHSINFYHISTQSPEDQLCMIRSFYHLSDEAPKFHTWMFGTVTGLSGILLILVMALIYVFALPFSRRYLFNMFWKTHNLFIVFYALTFIHGLAMMLQMSIFYIFFLGPMILFVADKLISLSRKRAELPLVKADVLPSNVTNLIFRKPPNFEYKSGQWVRIALTSQGKNEFHPFTLTSAPYEEHLSLHIRTVGPWTNNLRRTFDSSFFSQNSIPKILLDGPFGEGHQDWDRFQVSVLIGGGIGVTPFASILKDIANKAQSGIKTKSQKVYFLWITRTQKQFEWLTDIIRDVEENDCNGLVSVNIFITQLYQKFDLRTAMLYICERHFYKLNDRSLFTGLRAVTHFGRPDFISFFMSLQEEHPDIYRFGVFSCGPPAMTNNVETATQEMNKLDQSAFIHHYENF